MLTSTRLTATGLLAGLALSFAVPAMAVTATIFPASEITQAEVEAAQRAWADALLEIGAAGEPDKAKEIAVKRVGELYGYEIGPVLFKPTLTETPQTFRTTEEGAISYFVGQNPDYPKDKGFALQGWTDVQIENAAIFISDETAQTMGKVRFTSKDGGIVEVDKTWGYVRDASGKLQIMVHHSSLPNTPAQ
ncbi:hypothetical protein ADZ37_13585 [Pannonibacter phragmitetus]|uniref:Uncharacterized protein n=1 Tax=Pannonibacter phragmitetus TaxID=121719 RepID=A0A0L0IZ32_9HYPH|nr:hypothetical protein [Pannonibacter phragmitetus]ALV29882.1 hypothetical protein APZ00_05430 [Pannonibacter phragmitetus]KND18558.1 hypothetical protein ADZ37_13585 [Pannonibacter phragmitetus]MBA4204892.1 hypothetical protein [Polymorphum sp.]